MTHSIDHTSQTDTPSEFAITFSLRLGSITIFSPKIVPLPGVTHSRWANADLCPTARHSASHWRHRHCKSADLAATYIPDQSGQQVGDYRLLEEIGRGSMGIVSKAQRVSTGEFVAVKILSPELAMTDRVQQIYDLTDNQMPIATILNDGPIPLRERDPGIPASRLPSAASSTKRWLMMWRTAFRLRQPCEIS